MCTRKWIFANFNVWKRQKILDSQTFCHTQKNNPLNSTFFSEDFINNRRTRCSFIAASIYSSHSCADSSRLSVTSKITKLISYLPSHMFCCRRPVTQCSLALKKISKPLKSWSRTIPTLFLKLHKTLTN